MGYENLTDEELDRSISSNGGPVQSGMIAEKQTRQIKKLQDTYSAVLESQIAAVNKRLDETHKVDTRILVVAIITAVLALIPVIELIGRMFRH